MLRHRPTKTGGFLAAPAREPWGWAGSVTEFRDTEERGWIKRLSNHHTALTHEGPSTSQLEAWATEWKTLQTAFAVLGHPEWNLVAEFELPFEGGRRPDVVVLAGEAILALEFKGSPIIDAAQIDQTSA